MYKEIKYTVNRCLSYNKNAFYFQFPEEDINVDAYVVVFSITDGSTYQYATQLLKYLRNDLGTDRTIFVVANKTDLVRKRAVERNGN